MAEYSNVGNKNTLDPYILKNLGRIPTEDLLSSEYK